MPCEILYVGLALEHHTLLNRIESPCRDEYPIHLQYLLRQPLTVDQLTNPIFASRDFPYDPEICEDMCVADFCLKLQGCFARINIWHYAGKPQNQPLCNASIDNTNCTVDTVVDLPHFALERCGCHPKCISYKFRVIAEDKIRHSLGNTLSNYGAGF